MTRFRVIPQGEGLASGDALPTNVSDASVSTFLGVYTVTERDLNRPFTVAVGKYSTDLHGNQLGQTYTHPGQLRIVERPILEPAGACH